MKLLVDCLNSGCNVSPTVRQEIEETLLLPIANIQKTGDKYARAKLSRRESPGLIPLATH
ncbi:NACHT C-terminal helical domain 2-containing protein [Microcoleus sp. D3_18a_C4]|uniref:NACHT C-terminal helical domain 2-containing protein n=1 Tax=Microcoleus sp. D3_18a_C4 TaxID=3055332 RepID=UPI00403F3532